MFSPRWRPQRLQEPPAQCIWTGRYCGVGVPQIMEFEVDAQVLFDDTGDELI